MQRFLSHGDACARAESAALQLASATSAAKVDLDDEEPLKVYHAQHDELGMCAVFFFYPSFSFLTQPT